MKTSLLFCFARCGFVSPSLGMASAAALLVGALVALPSTAAAQSPVRQPATSRAAAPTSGTSSAATGSAYPNNPAIIAQLQKLGDNASLILEPFKVAGEGADEWRRLYSNRAPQRRDYGNKIVYAPERGTGVYCGMNHGAPHRLNDAWEYHLGSNTWYLLYFPDTNYSKTKSTDRDWLRGNAVFKDGYLQTKRGGMLNSVHTWDGLTYDPIAKRMLWANASSESPAELKAFAEATGASHDQLLAQVKPGSRMWMFDPDKRTWTRQMGAGPHPKILCQGGTLEYIPDLKKSLWYTPQWNESGMWAYDSQANTWEELKPNGGASIYHDKTGNFPRVELQSAYSPKHKKLVAVRGTGTWHYDILKNEWSKACEDEANNAHDANTVFAYDGTNDVFLLLNPKQSSLRAYRLDTNTWETLQPAGAGVATAAAAGYYDPALNVFVVYQGNRTWIYRYRNAK